MRQFIKYYFNFKHKYTKKFLPNWGEIPTMTRNELRSNNNTQNSVFLLRILLRK